MRIEKSLRNVYMSVISQVIIILLGFISRKVFINSLGTEYLGINAVLTNLLSMLSLVEGGMGVSIVYNLYKPLAENNQVKIIALVQLYKKVYSWLAIIIFLFSCMLFPFLHRFISLESMNPFMGIYYFIFVFKNIISYMNAHKWSLINSDQNGYVLQKYNLFFNFLTTLSKIYILLMTQNYILYLIIDLIIFLMQTLWNGHVVNKRYPYIIIKQKYKVDSETKLNIITNVKSIFLHNIGTYCVFSTDNLLISSFISTSIVGIYSNYTLVIQEMQKLLGILMNSVGASVGNLIATEGKEKRYQVFKTIYFINYWFYSIATICIYTCIQSFIDIIFGKELLLNNHIVLIILINFYLTGMRVPITTFKEKAGYFSIDRYMPLVEAMINLIFSILLISHLGLSGIFLGTSLSTLLIPFWTQPVIVYRKVFQKPIHIHFSKYFLFLIILVGVGVITNFIAKQIIVTNIWMLVLRAFVSFVCSNILLIFIFWNNIEFQYIKNILSNKVLYSIKMKQFI